jgi:hypothetical protein
MDIRYHKGHRFWETGMTTEVRRACFGTRRYSAIVGLWEVAGRHAKPAGRMPFLTSEAACRRYVEACEAAAVRAVARRYGMG